MSTHDATQQSSATQPATTLTAPDACPRCGAAVRAATSRRAHYACHAIRVLADAPVEWVEVRQCPPVVLAAFSGTIRGWKEFRARYAPTVTVVDACNAELARRRGGSGAAATNA